MPKVDIWMDREIKSWNMVLSKNEVDLTEFIKADLKRIADRAESQVSVFPWNTIQSILTTCCLMQ